MEHILVNELVPQDDLRMAIVHPTCQVLVGDGEDLTAIHIRLMREAGVREVFGVDRYDCHLRLRAFATSSQIDVLSLRAGDVLTYPITVGDGDVLVGWDTPITPRLVAELVEAGLTRVSIRRRGGLNEESYQRYRALVAPIEPLYRLPGRGIDALGARGGPSLRESVDPTADRTRCALRKEAYLDLHRRAIRMTRRLHRALAAGEAVEASALFPMLARLVNAYRIDRHLLVGVAGAEGDSLAAHTVGVTVCAINLASELGYPYPSVLEIAYGAYLQDIGMLQVPHGIRNKPGGLDAAETSCVRDHPARGLGLLEQIQGLPASTPTILSQAHERLDGTGYPGGMRGEDIHPFSRVVMAADVYQALASPRPYRPRSHPRTALAEVIRQADRGALERGVADGLVAALSELPVGSWLRLDDGRLARVVGTGSSPTRPRVQVLADARGRWIARPEKLEVDTRESLPAEPITEPGLAPEVAALAGF